MARDLSTRGGAVCCPKCGVAVIRALCMKHDEWMLLEPPSVRIARTLEPRDGPVYAALETGCYTEHRCQPPRAQVLADAIRCYLAGSPRSVLETALRDGP